MPNVSVKVYVSATIRAPVDQVWEFVRDFCPKWHPDVVDCHIENNEAPACIGCIRNFHVQDGGNIRERLLALTDTERSYTYAIIESPMSVQNYVARLSLLPITTEHSTYAQWTADFECPDVEKLSLAAVIEGVFLRGFDTLQARFSK